MVNSSNGVNVGGLYVLKIVFSGNITKLARISILQDVDEGTTKVNIRAAKIFLMPDFISILLHSIALRFIASSYFYTIFPLYDF